MEEKTRIHIACYVFGLNEGRLVNCKINGKEIRINPKWNKEAGFSGTGLLNLAIAEKQDELYGTGFIFGRGWSQPNGISIDEAVLMGQNIGIILKQKDISQYELVENQKMRDNQTPWDIGDLNDYRRGIESILHR
jgi:hypothetical protein